MRFTFTRRFNSSLGTKRWAQLSQIKPQGREQSVSAQPRHPLRRLTRTRRRQFAPCSEPNGQELRLAPAMASASGFRNTKAISVRARQSAKAISVQSAPSRKLCPCVACSPDLVSYMLDAAGEQFARFRLAPVAILPHRGVGRSLGALDLLRTRWLRSYPGRAALPTPRLENAPRAPLVLTAPHTP